MSQTNSQHKSKATVALVNTGLPPFRVHAHQRFAEEIPEIRVLTVLTHGDASRVWNHERPESIGFVDVTNGDRECDTTLKKDWARGKQIIDLIRREDVKAVVLGGYNDFGRLRVLNWCRRHRVPIFLWADNNIASDRLASARRGKLWSYLKRSFVANVIDQCDGCIACGSLGRQYWEYYGAKPEKVFISPYEPDYRLVQDIPAEELVQARKDYRLAKERRRIVFSGRLAPVKRLDLIIDAFAAIASERPDWDLVIVGDGELRSELESRVPESLVDRVIWTGFLGTQVEISKIYRISDILVLASDREAWGLVVNESVAAGMAVVANEVVGAAAELVVDGKNGRIIRQGSLESLREGLLKVTCPGTIDAMKTASSEVLAAWRRRGDPVIGLRKALAFANVISSSDST